MIDAKEGPVYVPKCYTGGIKWDDGTKHWYFYGKKHREDGPAVEYSDGNESWYLHGVELTVPPPNISAPQISGSWMTRKCQKKNMPRRYVYIKQN